MGLQYSFWGLLSGNGFDETLSHTKDLLSFSQLKESDIFRL